MPKTKKQYRYRLVCRPFGLQPKSREFSRQGWVPNGEGDLLTLEEALRLNTKVQAKLREKWAARFYLKRRGKQVFPLRSFSFNILGEGVRKRPSPLTVEDFQVVPGRGGRGAIYTSPDTVKPEPKPAESKHEVFALSL